MQIKDGWFEEQEDGTRDYIAILENGEVWRCKNAYPVSIKFDGIEMTTSNIAEVIITQHYTAENKNGPSEGRSGCSCSS
jgi:hypothetical protein